MKKIIKIIILGLILVFVFFRAGKMTGFLINFRVPSSVNEPNIKTGSLVFGTNLIKPKKFDFVFFNSEFNKYGDGIWAFRLCAEENDTIEIVNGVAFVNKENIDSKLNLKHAYLTDNKQLRKLKSQLKIKPTEVFKKNKDSSIIFISDDKIHILNDVKRLISIKTDNMVREVYQKPWNKDNFGPVIIPKGKVFLLGDNRFDSMDSRFIGLIDKKHLKGVLLFK